MIGHGNRRRRDDGLGPAAAAEIEKIGWPNVTTSNNYQLGIDDAAQIATHDVVWFVDAAREGDVPCTLRRISAALDITFTGHLLKPETVLAIADQQFGRCPEAHLVSIRGYEFDLREGLSDRARSNLALAVTLMRRRIAYLLKVSR
ncbi:hydrogenase maturation protease [Bradyrhizobium cenepequi]